MKNIKNTMAAMSLMAVLGLSATTANAGILLSDRGVNTNQTTCGSTETGVFNQFTGILIVGLSSVTGILLGDRSGLLLSDRPTPCVQNQPEGVSNTGIIIVG